MNLRCPLFGHDLTPPRWLSAQASRRDCLRCGRAWAVKESGEYAGAAFPWDQEWEDFYADFGLKRGAAPPPGAPE